MDYTNWLAQIPHLNTWTGWYTVHGQGSTQYMQETKGQEWW